MIAVSVPASGTAADRRMRRRRLAKIVLLVATAIVWVPIAIVITLAKANAR